MDDKKYIENHIKMMKGFEYEQINNAAQATIGALKNNGSIYFCGNGGSAADCNHLSGELSSYGFKAFSLVANPSIITALGNDISFENVFSSQLPKNGEGDMLYAFSTSGTSKNILKAIEAAKKYGMKIVGFTSLKGEKMINLVDFPIIAKTHDTPLAQVYHEIAYHLIWLKVLEKFGIKYKGYSENL